VPVGEANLEFRRQNFAIAPVDPGAFGIEFVGSAPNENGGTMAAFADVRFTPPKQSFVWVSRMSALRL
jgi:hypothetical protein